MLVVGAKSFAKEILEILHQNNELEDLVFYDDLSTNLDQTLFDRFQILKSPEQAEAYFRNTDKRFTLGIGNPSLRHAFCEKFMKMGGVLTSTISRNTEIGSYHIELGNGCNILAGAKISNSARVGMGCIVYYDSIITHDVEVGDFVEISPGVILLGRSRIGNFTHVGSGAIVLADVKVGEHVTVAAGSVVTKDIPDHVMVAGVPASIKKYR